MLLEISEGKFNARIERTDIDDEIEAIVVLVNMMAEEIGQTLRYYSQLNSPESILQFVQMLYILDGNFRIIYVNNDVTDYLKLNRRELIGTSFSKVLSKNSKESWQKIADQLLLDHHFNTRQKLSFVSHTSLVIEAICNITSVYNKMDRSQFIVITSFESKTLSQFIEDDIFNKVQQVKNEVKEPFDKPNILKNEKDIRMIEKVHDYILQHLETPLPSLNVLAHNFGTNEYKLKYGFKQLYHTTVFKFLIDERLKKASLLIENTSISIKSISSICGFKSVPHFSKAFKMKYQCTPRVYRLTSKWQ